RQALELSYTTADLHFPGHVAAYRAIKAQAEETTQFDGVVELAPRGLAVTDDEDERAMLALQGGEIAWRLAGDADTAKAFLVHAVEIAPDHPVISAYQAEIGPIADGAAPEPQPEAEPEPEPEPE